ncbi:MAG: putative transport system permease protein [Acidobacteriota bacterium]|jgi:putative ABC transport system permease protein|nr:putative transport system permease protein [Acidobacteriota bacterium]
MISPLLRSSIRHLLRHPWQFGLAVLGVALGVAVIVSIDLANASATRAFSLSSEAVTGRATHQVIGGPERLTDEAFRRLALETDLPVAPVVEGYVFVPSGKSGKPGRMLHLLGIDPFSERPFRPYLSGGTGGSREGSSIDLAPLLTRPAAGVLSATTAGEMGLKTGGSFTVRVGGGVRTIELVGVLEPGDESTRSALSDLLVMDIAAAQEILGRVGRIDRIDLIASESQLTRARAVLPAGAQILRSSARTETSEEMTKAFRLNLTALSLLALVCGVFLIYNTMVFSVVQRRTLIGTLRALGVTRGQVFALVLGEAAVVALLGTAAGLGAGVLLARELVRLVTQTINDLYFVVSVRELAVPAALLIKGGVIGIGATLAAALAPAIEATRAAPRAAQIRSALEARLRRVLPRVTLAGAALLAVGAGLLAFPGLVVSFAGLFAVILGSALLAPGATVIFMNLLRPVMGAMFGILGRMAAGGVVASLSRTAVAIAALVIAVSATIGIGVMIDSFRGTVVSWLESTLRSDVYLGRPGRSGGFSGGDLDPEVALRAGRLPGVERVNLLRRTEVPSPGGPVRMVILGTDLEGLSGYELKEGRPGEAWPAFQERDAVVVSEPFAHRHGVGAGDVFRLRTSRGERDFAVAGIYYDYASDLGLVLMSRKTYLRHWRDRPLTGFSVDLQPGADLEGTIRRLRSVVGGEGLSIQSNQALKKISMKIFDRTFRITSVLRMVSGLVAFIGVLSALMALQLERARELGVLRANGLTPGQVWHLVTSQTGLMGLAAGLLSIPVGLTLAAIMIFVINRRSFGWTIRMEVDPMILLGAMALALGAALLAGIYPAWKMARTSPALALREE